MKFLIFIKLFYVLRSNYLLGFAKNEKNMSAQSQREGKNAQRTQTIREKTETRKLQLNAGGAYGANFSHEHVLVAEDFFHFFNVSPP